MVSLPDAIGMSASMSVSLAALQEIQSNKPIVFHSAHAFDKEMVALIRRMLERDVVRRITLNQIKHNPWLTGSFVPESTQAAYDGEEEPPLERIDEQNNNVNILIVEDVPLIRETTAGILKSMLADRQGVTIDDVGDGDNAVSFSKRKRYSIIMMDVHMTRVSGCDASRMIRKHEQEYSRREAKIVGVTADDHPEIHDFCRDAGMTQVWVDQ